MHETDSLVPVPQQELAAPVQASWRNTIKVHPACELIPPMPADDVRALGEDILKNGLISPITLWLASKDAQAQLLDGRSRLDALELALGRPVRVTSQTFRGRTTWSLEADDDAGESVPVLNLIGEEGFPFGTKIEFDIVILDSDTDPYEYVKSANIHRRHLTAEKKREAIANLIKATPEKSDRQIAKTVKASPTFVGKVRAEMEATGDVSTVDTRTDARGRQQPARKSKPSAPAADGKAKSALAGGTKPFPVESDSVGETASKDVREVLEKELEHERGENIRARTENRELTRALEAKLDAIPNEQFYDELVRRLSPQFLKTHQAAMKAIRREFDALHVGPTLDLKANPLTDNEVTKH
jgi:hypothetical protein